ncbi:hypothetical protein, partial [Gilliamella sp. Bif1-4]|uniref:hypothetical protein n=1 Tax=Gilliamella sp. Bif1-4 TaxID=3120233 RepID=UPI0011472BBC
MNNDQLICNVETKLIQVRSMAKIALDNTTYKCAGYDEPFIEQADMSNLLWVDPRQNIRQCPPLSFFRFGNIVVHIVQVIPSHWLNDGVSDY